MKVRVFLRSVPGPWELYDGYVDVWVDDLDDAFRAAALRLSQTSFPDRPSMSSWRCTGLEILQGATA